MASPLPPAPWSLTSQRDDEIRDVLEGKSCRSSKLTRIFKRHSLKYGQVPPKLVIKAPWRALYVDPIGPYTLKGKDGSSIDFMCLTMIDPATSWFEIVELPIVTKLTVPNRGEG